MRIWLYFELCIASLLGKIQNRAKCAPVKTDALGWNTFRYQEEGDLIYVGKLSRQEYNDEGPARNLHYQASLITAGK